MWGRGQPQHRPLQVDEGDPVSLVLLVPFEQATGLCQCPVETPQRGRCFVEHAYLSGDLVLIGQGLVALDAIP
jgi:hypothetical protein